MRIIDMETWPRREHYNLFRTFNHPHFSMCANMDATSFFQYVKEHHYSFTVSIAYLIARTANTIPEYRQRIQGEKVVEYETVSPAYTILANEDLFSFCTVDYVEDFQKFAVNAAEQVAKIKDKIDLDTKSEGDDLLFMSPIPWVSFTSFNHPMQFHPSDSVPRFAWGKIFEEGGKLKMPLQSQGHHALMDGVHMGRFFDSFQKFMDQPEMVLGGK